MGAMGRKALWQVVLPVGLGAALAAFEGLAMGLTESVVFWTAGVLVILAGLGGGLGVPVRPGDHWGPAEARAHIDRLRESRKRSFGPTAFFLLVLLGYGMTGLLMAGLVG